MCGPAFLPSQQGLFNFKPSVRPVPLECHIQVPEAAAAGSRRASRRTGGARGGFQALPAGCCGGVPGRGHPKHFTRHTLHHIGLFPPHPP